MRQTSLKAILDCNLTLIETDFRPEMPKISLPMLIIHGEQDIPSQSRCRGGFLRSCCPIINSSSTKMRPHGLYITHMELLNADLLAFASK